MDERDHGAATRRRRRRLLQAGLSATALGATFGAGVIAAPAFDWKRFKGQRIDVLLDRNPRADLLARHHDEFELMTGIGVATQTLPEDEQRRKAMSELASSKARFDVVAISYELQQELLAKNRWLEDLRPMLADKSLTEPVFGLDDFAHGGVRYATRRDGRIDSLPIALEPWILYCNKRMFDASGVAYPKTFAEMLDAAVKLHETANSRCGFVTRGIRGANVPPWASLLLGNGGQFIDADGKLATDSPEAIAAATLYQTLLSNSGPWGAVGYDWPQAEALFRQGRAAMWLDSVSHAESLEDTTRSRVAGEVHYAAMPDGPRQPAAILFGDGLGIRASGKKKGPSWYYLQWASNRTNQARMLVAATGVPARISAYAAARSSLDFKGSEQWVDCLLRSIRIGQPGLPAIVPVTEFREAFGAALVAVMAGEDPAAEFTSTTAAFQQVLDKRS